MKGLLNSFNISDQRRAFYKEVCIDVTVFEMKPGFRLSRKFPRQSGMPLFLDLALLRHSKHDVMNSFS